MTCLTLATATGLSFFLGRAGFLTALQSTLGFLPVADLKSQPGSRSPYAMAFRVRPRHCLGPRLTMVSRSIGLLGLYVLVQVANGVMGSQPCNRMYFGPDAMVCVCNSTYCDTLDPLAIPPPGAFIKYKTSKAGSRLERSEGKFEKTAPFPGLVFALDPTQRYQYIKGFGGAITDAVAINVLSLSPNNQENLLRSYFTEQGIEYNLLRLPMGSCDFSNWTYTYDDSPGDFELKNFRLLNEDLKMKIPLVHRAKTMSKKPISLVASPWTSPLWMRTPEAWKGRGTLKGQAGDKYHKTWANYFVRFLDEYAKQNLTFWAVTAENEPTAGLIPGYGFQCLGFTAEQQRDFIAMDLGPALRNSSHKDIRLIILDDNRLLLPYWAKVVLNEDSQARRYVHGIAVHWYFDFISPIEDTVAATHELFPDYFLISTEACAGVFFWEADVILGSWDRGNQYSRNIMANLNNHVTGWVDWNIALDLEGGPNWVKNYVDSPIIVDTSADIFYKQPMFYHMGHFSKFIPEGSQRIGVEVIQQDLGDSLEHVALLRPDGSAVLVVLNRSDFNVTFGIHDTPGIILAQIPANSIQTYLWQRQ